MAKKWIPKKEFKPSGEKGKLHRELGVATDKPIGAARIAAATHSKDKEISNDAIRAQTMSHWRHGGKKSPLYTHPRSKRS